MALRAGRVGVSPSQVDSQGNITGGGSSVTVVDNLNSTSSTDALSAKQGKVLKEITDGKEDASKIGGFEFRTNNGVAQYRTSSTGEWVNFNSGGGVSILDFGDTGDTLYTVFMYCKIKSGENVNIKKVKIYSDANKTVLVDEQSVTDNMFIITNISTFKNCYFNLYGNDAGTELLVAESANKTGDVQTAGTDTFRIGEYTTFGRSGLIYLSNVKTSV